MLEYLDAIFGEYEHYRRWRGGTWFKILCQNFVTDEDLWRWIRETETIKAENFNYHTKESY